MIKPDSWIREMVRQHRMIEPFAPEQMRDGVVSYGLSAYGYDLRVADDFRVFNNYLLGDFLDPKNFDVNMFTAVSAAICEIPPNSYALARSLEYFRIPRNVLAVVQGKSTYARCGVILNVTPLEPEWEGFITMAVVNAAPAPVRIHANEGIGQVLFFESDTPPDVSYADKQGKYQAQGGITGAKV
jgi:dCTP deaminase